MISTWQADVHAVLDTWTSYHITLDEFKDAVIVKALGFAKKNGGTAWIVDSSKATHAFSREIQKFIAEEQMKLFFDNGIKFFLIIKPEVPGLTSLTVRSYSASADPAGIQLVDVSSVTDAILWLKEHGNP